MNVLFDARFITPKKTGVGKYTENLLAALQAVPGGPRIRSLFFDPVDPAISGASVIRAPVPFDSHPRGDWWRNTGLIELIRNHSVDVYHSPGFYCIQRKVPAAQVVTIHDTAVFDRPESTHWKFAFFLRAMIRSSARRADRIIAVSRFVADRLADLIPRSADRIRVIPQGVSPVFAHVSPDSIRDCRTRWRLPDRFILSVSTVEPRKNLLQLMDAYGVYRRRCRNPLPLVIAGKDGYRAERIRERAQSPDLDAAVRFLGYVRDDDVAALYRLATMMVFPSVYEGFGLPVLEAMQSGCPVIASNTASIPELAGDAAELVSPDSCLQISEAMHRLTEQPERREWLIRQGQDRAGVFSWKHIVEETIEVYREAAQHRSQGTKGRKT